MKLIKYDKFLEALLSIPVLRSERNGIERGNTLVDKLEKDEPKLKLDNDDIVNIDKDNAEEISQEITTNGEYDNSKGIETFINKSNRYKKVLKGEDGQEYKLNQFKKDKDFGSSGAGVNTRNYENLQCIFLAHKLVRPNEVLSLENITRLLDDYKDDGNKIANLLRLHIPNTKEIDDILVNALNNPDWATTLIDVTNDLYNYTSRNIPLFNPYFKGKYNVYHISSMKDKTSPFYLIRKKFSELLPTAVNIEFSKYCPADVIVTVDGIDLERQINSIDPKKGGTIKHLTELLNNLFIERTLIAISLKKVGRTVNSIKTYSIIVNNEKYRPLPSFEIESFSIYNDIERGIGSKIKVTSSWKDAKGIVIDGEDRFLTIDSSNTSNKVNVDGEVEGKFSRHGKVSYIFMKQFINSIRDEMNLNKIQNIEEYSKLIDYTEDEIIIKINSILDDLDKLKRIYKNKIKIENPVRKGTKISTGRLIGNNNKKNKLISKLQSLQIINAILQVREVNTKKSNEIINKIMRYALSIKADEIITPRYVRVI